MARPKFDRRPVTARHTARRTARERIKLRPWPAASATSATSADIARPSTEAAGPPGKRSRTEFEEDDSGDEPLAHRDWPDERGSEVLSHFELDPEDAQLPIEVDFQEL
jgi:hypothetical protein